MSTKHVTHLFFQGTLVGVARKRIQLGFELREPFFLNGGGSRFGQTYVEN